MAAFDPAAATAAYMATLSPAGHAKATAYTQGGHWLLLWSWLVAVVAAWLILRSGLIVRAEVALERRKPRLILTSFVASVLFLVMDFILELEVKFNTVISLDIVAGIARPCRQPLDFAGFLSLKGINHA